MKNIKSNVLLIITIIIFGGVGVYLTFFASNISKYDSKTKAYKIEVSERYDDDHSNYYPTYYYKVNGEEYTCESNSGSSIYPNTKKNMVYYDSNNPKKCLTQYDKKNGKIIGFAFLLCTLLLIVLFIKNQKDKENEYIYKDKNIKDNNDVEINQKVDESVLKTEMIISKISLIISRVILGIIIFGLLLFILFETLIVKQTIKAKDYIDTTAVISDKKSDNTSTVFDDYIYTFEDKDGNKQEIVISVSKDDQPKDSIKIKYDENNPKEFYEEGSTFNTSGMIGYVVKIIILIVLIIIFFNTKLLRKFHFSISKK